MDGHDEQGTSHQHCPNCGAEVPADSRFCGVCGADMRAEPAQASASQAEATGGAAGEARPTDGKLCNWCGSYSPPAATRCVSCGAVFPTPEGDMALEHAAQERIKAMEGDIKPQRKSGWWPFGSR